MNRDAHSVRTEVEISRIQHRGRDRILLLLRYNENLINRIKNIAGRRFSKTYKSWHLPYEIQSMVALRELNISYDVKDGDSNDPILLDSDRETKVVTSTNDIENGLEKKVHFLVDSFDRQYQNILKKYVSYLIIEGYSWNSIDLFSNYAHSYMKGAQESFVWKKEVNVENEVLDKILLLFLNFRKSLGI